MNQALRLNLSVYEKQRELSNVHTWGHRLLFLPSFHPRRPAQFQFFQLSQGWNAGHVVYVCINTSGTWWGLTSTFLLGVSMFSQGECSRKLKCVVKPSLSNCTCKTNQFWNFKRVSSHPFSPRSKEYSDYIVLNYFVLVDRFKPVGWLLLLSHFSRVRLCATPQTAAHQAPLSLGFSRQEHWSGLPFPSPRKTLNTNKTIK